MNNATQTLDTATYLAFASYVFGCSNCGRLHSVLMRETEEAATVLIRCSDCGAVGSFVAGESR